jgi:hypothetical protein
VGLAREHAVSDGGNVEWARTLRAQLRSDIRVLGARAREGGDRPEELGLLPDRDRLAALQKRLDQVERLIDALEYAETTTGTGDGWPADLGDPSDPPDHEDQPGHEDPRPRRH